MTLEEFIDQVGAIDRSGFALIKNECDCSINGAVTLQHVLDHVWTNRGDTRYVNVFVQIVERALDESSQVGELICTCLLESLQHRSIREDTGLITSRLLPKARAYCLAMDEFYGSCTPGVEGDRAES